MTLALDLDKSPSGRGTGRPEGQTARRTTARRQAAHPPTAPGRAARGAASVTLLAEARTGRRIVAAARELLASCEYAAVDFHAVAQAAGVRPEEVGRRFPTRMALTLAALELPPAAPSAFRGRPGGSQTVERFLSFWELGANADILTGVLRAAMRDARTCREVEDVLGDVLFAPLASGLGTTDAGPRARLVSSALIGLAVTRYILREEPIASADHETIAAWMGPSLDCYLLGALGA